jgi:hypothetical protein
MARSDMLVAVLQIASIFIFTLILLSVLTPSIATYTPETVRVHQILDVFRQRGQLFIETFPPLSYCFTAGERPLTEIQVDSDSNLE